MTNRPCAECGGFGQARTRNGTVTCPSCNGTGRRPAR